MNYYTKESLQNMTDARLEAALVLADARLNRATAWDGQPGRPATAAEQLKLKNRMDDVAGILAEMRRREVAADGDAPLGLCRTPDAAGVAALVVAEGYAAEGLE